ncbi:MAG: serine/threonine protein kinase [Planctomycetes bacterium]|nr:serine/threonine protein kinase [Planctomycetota bacterium]
MLSEKDVLILKMALERRMVNARSYEQVRAGLARGERVAQSLREAGVGGKEVGVLVDLATPLGGNTKTMIPARSDVENILVGRALVATGMASQADVEKAQKLVDEAGTRDALFYSVAEVLAEEGRVDLLAASNLRSQAQSRVATCPRCFRHYLLPRPGSSGCKPCQTVIHTGDRMSAIDAWREGHTVRPPSGRLPAVAEPSPELMASDPELQVADVETSLVMADDLGGSVQELSASFGPYTIKSEIDRGANGIVYRAQRTKGGPLVALKVLMAGPKASAQQTARFKREAEIGQKLHHPGIASVLDAGMHGGYPYLAMELAQGETLESRLKDSPIPGPLAATIMSKVSRAVDYLHKQGVIHRDLKPENVIVSDDDEPKLIDLGLAKTSDNDDAAKLTADASTLGTPSYMSPEQVRGESDRVTPASDVYGLGAILYSVLTGQVPFQGQNFMDLFRLIVEEEPVPPSKLVPTDAPLEGIVLRCLAKDAGDRYQTAAALADDLDRYVAGQAVEAATPSGRNSKAAPNTNAILLGVLALLVALIGLAIVGLAVVN